ncbi:MAG TPA: GNAT family protein [Jatrophihabitans sp.]|nr:GNAT family protein [Jatrophihabitans sp.]
MTSPDEWYALPALTGQLIRLEPLTIEHAPEYFAAAGTGPDADEVFRWMYNAPPKTLDDARADIAAGLAARSRGERFPYAQIDAATGEVAGTTSYYDVVPALRTIAIGHTWLGRRWWRSGHNTESKLLMLTHAFDTLGAARVVWHTDIYNERSQRAIERLGATREGELRKHRIRRDGSWRTTVQYSMTDDDWPAARDYLTGRLAEAGGLVDLVARQPSEPPRRNKDPRG